jgi:UDPglucose 6-dehydrogenase
MREPVPTSRGRSVDAVFVPIPPPRDRATGSDQVRAHFWDKVSLLCLNPQALSNAQMDLIGVEREMIFEQDPYRAADGASAIVLITEWGVFKTLNYEAIYERMKKPALIVDGRNILEHQKLFAMGFNVYPIGKPNLTQ